MGGSSVSLYVSSHCAAVFVLLTYSFMGRPMGGRGFYTFGEKTLHKGVGKSRAREVQEPVFIKRSTQRPGGRRRAPLYDRAPAALSVVKKVNWMNREGFFGRQAIDEDALEMLGNLPTDRAMVILDTLMDKADAGEIWNPNSYIVKAAMRHTRELLGELSVAASTPVSVLKKVIRINQQGFFGQDVIDEDATQMLGSLPEDRALRILDSLEEKAGFGEIWNPSSYVVKAVMRHNRSISERTATATSRRGLARTSNPARALSQRSMGRSKDTWKSRSESYRGQAPAKRHTGKAYW